MGSPLTKVVKLKQGNGIANQKAMPAPSNSSGNTTTITDGEGLNTSLTSSLIPSNSVSVSTKHKAPIQPLRNNITDKHLNTKHNHRLLCFGWIRTHCTMRSQFAAKDNIPSNVLELCFEYLYIERILFCFIAAENEKISAIQAVDVNNIYKTQFRSAEEINVGYDCNGVCIHSSNIRFPPLVTRRFNLLDNDKPASYHTFFKVGSEKSRAGKMLIVPKDQFCSQSIPSRSATFRGFELLLPDLPTDNARFGNTVSYSPKYGLVSCGGTHPETGVFLGSGSYSGVVQLNWNWREYEDVQCLSECKWKHLRRLNTGRSHACSTFFKHANGTEQLFVCGGDLNGSVEVYDFESNKWSDVANTNVSRECAGIYYDQMENLIYLGGGHGAQRKIECYDLIKNEWNIFPNTVCKHDFYPSLFKTSFHYDILYIVSPKSNLCEYIDRREGKWSNAKWNIIYDHELHDKLFKIPHEVDFDQFRFIN